MGITAIFVGILFISVTTTQAGLTKNQCTSNSDCPSSLACIFDVCDDTCKFISQGERATCKVVDHKVVFTCNPGFEHPKGTDNLLCLPVEWACHVNNENPGIIDCDSPNWICWESDGQTLCGEVADIAKKFSENKYIRI